MYKANSWSLAEKLLVTAEGQDQLTNSWGNTVAAEPDLVLIPNSLKSILNGASLGLRAQKLRKKEWKGVEINTEKFHMKV